VTARRIADPSVLAAVPDVEALTERLDALDYLADPGLATAMFLALGLAQPLLLEGEAGVGKTEAARALAAALDTPLIRLQCYEGLDAAEALYEWNYPRQLLAIRRAEAGGGDVPEAELFGETYLVPRPLLQAIRHPGPRPAVLLVDEVDRADDPFEAFLLELLADAAVTIPELGTVTAEYPPVVVLTSNRTRELHDALKRRCLYHWIDCRRPRPSWPTRWRARCAGCGPPRCRSPRGSPRASTGWPRSSCSESSGWTARARGGRSARC
jgi:MoxR-like ATPase